MSMPVSPRHPEAAEAADVARLLLAWLPGVRRDLPWRRRRDPYAVWVSEVMLQQTQVATVIPYFERWLTRFPDIASLAAASQDALLKAWEGLGYYARARNLQRAAQEVMAHHNGTLPSEREALLALPGIGRYTAGAILSLAFGRHEPILDGNVRRVLCRVYDIAENPKAPAVDKRLWELAGRLVREAPAGQPGDLNEALMELGALVCVPGQPDCSACPLAAVCLARADGVQAERPVTAKRVPTPHYAVAAALITDGAGRYLIARRPTHGLLGGLWEFPSTPAEASGTGQGTEESLPDFLARAVEERLGLQIAVGAQSGRVSHAYTHFRITLQSFHCRTLSGQATAANYYTGVAWVPRGELENYPFPVTHLKILKSLSSQL
jgi:A/G-specific adenine glycosylase